MMGSVQARGMWHRAIRDRPLGDHFVFFEINDRDVAIAIYNVPIVTYNFFPDGSRATPAGSPPGNLMLSTNLAVFVSTMSMEAP